MREKYILKMFKKVANRREVYQKPAEKFGLSGKGVIFASRKN